MVSNGGACHDETHVEEGGCVASLTREQARTMLRDAGLRATSPRLAVLMLLSAEEGPLSHTETLKHLGDSVWEPSTVYRVLVKLADVGLLRVVTRAEGMARYAVASRAERDPHGHPHFACCRCGKVSCLPGDVVMRRAVNGRWGVVLRHATIQFQGTCPDCLSEEENP